MAGKTEQQVPAACGLPYGASLPMTCCLKVRSHEYERFAACRQVGKQQAVHGGVGPQRNLPKLAISLQVIVKGLARPPVLSVRRPSLFGRTPDGWAPWPDAASLGSPHRVSSLPRLTSSPILLEGCRGRQHHLSASIDASPCLYACSSLPIEHGTNGQPCDSCIPVHSDQYSHFFFDWQLRAGDSRRPFFPVSLGTRGLQGSCQLRKHFRGYMAEAGQPQRVGVKARRP